MKSSPPDPIAGHTPRYFGVVEREGQQYLKMGSVTEGFERPHLLDIKMGVRCYTEEETTKTKLRKDLYERLITMGESHHLTELEKEQKAITKSRWMELRDAMSSTTTLGFRIDAVLTPVRRSAPVSPVALKAASGGFSRVPLVQVTNLARTIRQIQEAGVWTVGLAGEGEQTLGELDLTGRTALIMGSEGDGLRRLTREHCDHVARLPTRDGASLNVAVATGVALYEMVRQRR